MKVKSVSIREREYVAVNKTAGIVTSPQEKYTPNKRLGYECWDVPPAMYNIPPHGLGWMIGTRIDRMVIVGYFGSSRKIGSLWVARCDCGKYEKRSGFTILLSDP